MLDRSKIGTEFESFTTQVEKSRLKFFAKAIGETNPIYFDEAAAQAAGHKSLLAPPTYPFILGMDGPDFLPAVTIFGLNIGGVLHGNQAFEYFTPIYAGDEITVSGKIANVYDAKNGSLDFVDQEYSYTNQDGTLVAKATNTLIYRNR